MSHLSDSLIQQHLQVRKTGGFKIMTDRVLLELTGRDVASYLQTQTTNDVLSLQPGQGQANALLDRKAHLKAHFTLHRWDNQFWILVDKNQWDALYHHLENFHFVEDVHIVPVPDRYSFILIQGPQSQDFLESLSKQPISPIEPYRIHSWTYHNQDLFAIQTSETGENGFLLVVKKAFLESLVQDLKRVGQAFQWVEIEDNVMNSLRIEAGIPKYGIDMTEENLLPETGLEKICVSYSKGCYLGQEVVARIKTYGVIAQALIGLEFEGKEVPPFDSPIVIDGQTSGTVKSGLFSPSLQKPIAMAYLARNYRKPGETIHFEVADNVYQGTLRFLPFYHPLTEEERARELYEKALTIFAEDQEEEAIPLLKEAIRKKPDFSDAYESLGVILSRQEHYQEAIDVMTQLTHVNPNEPMARTNLSIFYMKLGLKAEAEAQLAEARRISFEQQKKETVDQKKANEEIALKEHYVTMFKEVLETEDSEDLVANYGLGKAYVDLQNYELAIPYFEKAIAIQKHYSVAYLQLGKALEQTQQIDRAKTIYQQGIVAASQKGDLMPLKEMEQRLMALQN